MKRSVATAFFFFLYVMYSCYSLVLCVDPSSTIEEPRKQGVSVHIPSDFSWCFWHPPFHSSSFLWLFFSLFRISKVIGHVLFLITSLGIVCFSFFIFSSFLQFSVIIFYSFLIPFFPKPSLTTSLTPPFARLDLQYPSPTPASLFPSPSASPHVQRPSLAITFSVFLLLLFSTLAPLDNLVAKPCVLDS